MIVTNISFIKYDLNNDNQSCCNSKASHMLYACCLDKAKAKYIMK